MADIVQFKYRAFLSYSHADATVAKRVHTRFEGFRIDKDLVGRATPAGPVPKSLRPIFLDRNDFDAGSSIAASTRAALDDAAAFILIASPDAARSKYVNEEVRLFRWHHHDRSLIPLIVRGKPGDPDQECFPSTLRFALGADGTMTDAPADIIAADLRDEGDGFDLALAKVIARLIGLAPDDVYRRAERQRRRVRRWRAAVAVLIAGLAVGGGLVFLQSRQRQQTINDVAALVEKYSAPYDAQAAVPGHKASLGEAITAIAEGAATDPRYAHALELLKVGKAADAEPLLKAVAEDRAQRADREAKSAAAAYRTLASIAAISDHQRAREYYAEAAQLDPSDTDGMYWNGWYQAEAGHLAEAEAAYRRVIAESTTGHGHRTVRAQLGIGDIDFARGSSRTAEADYRAAANDADRLVKSDPNNADWQSDLSVSYNKIANVQIAQGDLAGALA
jgi:tetratricopeptide (TPR) repeat protein